MCPSTADVSFRLLLGVVLLGFLLGACSLTEDDAPAAQRVERTFPFDEGKAGWMPVFADYPTNADTSADGMAFTFDRRSLPDEVPEGKGLFLRGRNTSDDLFMGLRRKVSGLAPNTTYDLTVDLTLASASPSDCVGIGGAPGESVWVKAGGSAAKPERTAHDGWYRLTIDKGGQSQGGTQARVLGDVANGVEDCHDTPFRLIERTMGKALSVTTSDDGTLWLLVGTDSGFEGTTRLYYDRIRVVLAPQ
jgi:hypothetical protein